MHWERKVITLLSSLLSSISLFKDDNTSRDFTTYCENIRRTIKSITIDLKSKEHLLQETIANWKIYHTHYDSLENWLNEGEHVLRRSSEEKLVCTDP